jgi:hypothetical protein
MHIRNKLTILASLSDILAVVFGVMTAVLGIGQIIVTCLIRRGRRPLGTVPITK